MYRRLIVLLDGSTFAEHALPFAASIARRAGAMLQIIQAHVPLASLYSGGELVADLTLDSTIRENETAYLDGVVKRLSEIVPVPVSRALLDGPIAEAIHEYAVAAAADLVVMATHGRGALSRFWLGSVADKLVRCLPMPILLVRPQEQASDLGLDHVFQHILVPLDGSELAEHALGPAVALGSLMGADYLLVRVVDTLQPAGRDAQGFLISGLAPEGLEHLREEAVAYLERTAERLRARSLQVFTRVLVSSQAAQAILQEAGTPPIDLIALETHGRGGLARLLLGSVADKVVRGAQTPVLVHHPLAKITAQTFPGPDPRCEIE
jgi:nucleotide-binding universal stress UspA family protein